MRGSIALLVIGSTASLAQTGPCGGEPYLRRDTLLGEWETVENGKAVGHVRFRKAVHGCAIVEDRLSPAGVASKALHYYDAQASVWRVLTVGPDGVSEGQSAAPAPVSVPREWSRKPLPKATAQPHPACAHREFDSWLGRWNVFTPRGAQAGTNHIYSAAGGCLLVENWTNSSLGTGMSFNFLDAKLSAWRQVWVAPGSLLDLVGRFAGGVLRYEGRKPGGVTRTRLSFMPNLDESVRQYWEQSTDSGKTWLAAFDGMYRRAAQGSIESLAAELESAAEATAKARPQMELIRQLVAAEKFAGAAASKLMDADAPASAGGFDPGAIEPLLATMIGNRNIRLAAWPASAPGSPANSAAELLDAFQRERAGVVATLRAASLEALHGARMTHPLGGSELNAYKWLFALAAQNRRLLAQASDSQAPPMTATALRQWNGHWSGDGTFQGKPARLELDITPMLAGKFDELRAAVIIGGARIFEGRAMYGADSTAAWADSAGNTYVVKGRWTEGRLVSEWGDPVRGRSTYAVNAAGQMEVTDEVRRPDGNFAPFFKYMITRADGAASSNWHLSGLAGRQTSSGKPWFKAYDSESMLMGVYGLEAGAAGEPLPRSNDSVYVVESGRAILAAGDQRIPVQPGSVVTVKSGVERRFLSVEDSLKVLVVSPKP